MIETKIIKRKPHSEETKKKMSLSKLGIKNPMFGKCVSKETKEKIRAKVSGSFNHNYGKTLSKEHRLKISKNRRGKMTGKSNHAWRGGVAPLGKIIRKLTEYKEWREKIFNRDEYSCQFCGLSGIYLEPDHIKPFSIILKEYGVKDIASALSCDELWDISNGRTLCKQCHSTTSTYKYKAINYIQ